MCKVIAIANQKGGVGKTTTTSDLGIGLEKLGKRVLVVDADAQGSLTASLGYTEPDALERTLASVLAADSILIPVPRRLASKKPISSMQSCTVSPKEV